MNLLEIFHSSFLKYLDSLKQMLAYSCLEMINIMHH